MADNILYAPQAEAVTEQIVRKSRFIAYLRPCADEMAAARFIAEIQKKHHDATHNVYAYQIGEHNELQRSTDDGEPAGTAGRPILEIIKQAGLCNTAIVVTRYFGGILLGTGGLVRAYSGAAQAVIEAAGRVELIAATQYHLDCAYHQLAIVQNLLASLGAQVGEINYTDRISLICLIPQQQRAAFMQGINQLSDESIRALVTGEQLFLRKPV